MAPKPSRDTLIHCDACGEDYSSTYRRCPFCGARNDPRRVPTSHPEEEPYFDDDQDAQAFPAVRPGRGEEMDDGYVFDGQDAFDDEDYDGEYYDAPRPKGGKRLAPKQGGGIDLPPINWPRLITFLCSLVIIVAALIIVFTFIYPQLRSNKDKDVNKDPDSASSTEVSNPPSQDPAIITSNPASPSIEDTPPSVDPDAVTTDPPVPAQPEVTGITLTSNGATLAANDITLLVGESAQMGAIISPSNWSGPVTWTSSNPEWITVSENGLVTNVNNTGAFHNAFLTVTAGGVTVRCEVRVRSVQSNPSASQPPASQAPSNDPPASQAPSSGGNPTVGRPGTIVNAEGGLRVRSGPGTTYEVLASLQNGNSINVVEDAGGGWYKITFIGSGQTITGYIMGEYISTN